MALSLLAANNAQSVLAAGISAAATTLTVNTGTGVLFPSPVSGTSFFKLTLIDAATGTLTEIVHVAQRVGDQMTIERGQEGTVARIWSANDLVVNMMTAGTLSYLKQNIDGKLAKDQNGADIPDKALFRQNIDLVKQTSGTDANAGRVLVLPANSTGAFGVGGAANNPVSQRGGFFAYSPESSALPDIGLNMNGVGYQSAYDTNRRGQIFQSFNDGALRYRITTSNTAADNATPWRVAFDNINLVPTRDDQTTLSLTSAAAIHAWALANTSRSFRNDGINTDASTIRFGSGAFTKVNGTYSILTASSSASTPGLKIQAGDADGYVSYNVWTDKNLPNPMSASETVGIPLPFPGSVAPSGWLKCNGQTFDTAQYPVLASRYPSGQLPDLRGEFIRGWDDKRKVDPGRSLLSAQNDAMQPITAKWVIDDQAAGGDINYPPSGALYIDSTATVNYDTASTRDSFGARGVFDSSRQT